MPSDKHGPHHGNKRYDYFTVTTQSYVCHRDMWFRGICGIVCPLSFWNIYAKPKEFIGRQTDQTIHGKTLSHAVDS